MSKRSACVALLVSLLSPSLAAAQVEEQAQPHVFVGVHGGFNFSNGSVEDERFGVQGSIPLVWRLTADPAFSYLYNFPDDPAGVYGGSAWETYFIVRVHPLGNDSFLTLGYGFTIVHASIHTKDQTFSDSDTDGTDVGVIGLTFPKGRVRPFAEMYLMDLLERQSAVRTSTVRGRPPGTISRRGSRGRRGRRGNRGPGRPPKSLPSSPSSPSFASPIRPLRLRLTYCTATGVVLCTPKPAVPFPSSPWTLPPQQ